MAIRGSGALFDACSSVLVFEGEKGTPPRVSHEKARASGITTDDFQLEIADVEDRGNPRAGVTVTASAAASHAVRAEARASDQRLARTAAVQDALRELFRQHPDQPGADAIAARLGLKAADVRASLTLLVEAKEVERTGKTRDRRHKWLGPAEGRE
jgi:hypothetical protein